MCSTLSQPKIKFSSPSSEFHFPRSASPPAQGTRPILLTAPTLPSLAMYKLSTAHREERDTRRQKSTLVSYHEARVKSAGARGRSSDPPIYSQTSPRSSRPSSAPSRKPPARPPPPLQPPPLPSKKSHSSQQARHLLDQQQPTKLGHCSLRHVNGSPSCQDLRQELRLSKSRS